MSRVSGGRSAGSARRSELSIRAAPAENPPKGPSGWLTVAPQGPISMGRNMALSLVVFLAVALLDAYVAWHALGPGAHYRAVFRIVATVGILAFGVGPVFNSIWYHRPWRAYLSDVIDALLFGLAMAGVFGWLWPR